MTVFYDFAVHQSAVHSVWTSIFTFQSVALVVTDRTHPIPLQTIHSDHWKLELLYATSDVERLKIHHKRFCFLSMWFSFSCLHDGFWLITSLHGWWLQLSHAKQLNCFATSAAAGRKRNCVRESGCKRGSEKEKMKETYREMACLLLHGDPLIGSLWLWATREDKVCCN